MVSRQYLFSEDNIIISYIILYGILNILGKNVLYQVKLVKMDRLCIDSYETADIFWVIFRRAFWRRS